MVKKISAVPKLELLPEPTSYALLFQHYIEQGVCQSLARVQACEYVVPDDVREQAWHVLSFALDVAPAWEVTKELLLALAPKMEQAGFREDWIAYLEQGIQASREKADSKAEAGLSFQLGLLYRLLSKHEYAIIWLTKSFEVFEVLEEQSGQAKALNQLAYVAWQQHDMNKAMAYAHKAYDLLDASNLEQSMSLSALGLVASEQARWQQNPALWKEAEEYHRTALQIRRKVGNEREIGWSLQNLANTLVGQRRFSEAIHCFEHALQIMSTSRDRLNRAIVLMNLGIVYYDNQEHAQALHRYAEALATFEILDDQLNLGRCHVNQGLCYLALGELSSAELCFERAIQLYERLENESLRLNAVDGLALTFLAQQRYGDAHKVLSQAMADVVNIPDAPNYDYLHQCFVDHLAEAKAGLEEERGHPSKPALIV